MEPARSSRTGILQVKEFSTGKGIKSPIEARFLQVKEKRHSRRELLDRLHADKWADAQPAAAAKHSGKDSCDKGPTASSVCYRR